VPGRFTGLGVVDVRVGRIHLTEAEHHLPADVMGGALH
jgi:hypothetical protein